MVNYYKQRQRAAVDIRRLYKLGKTKQEMYYHILMNHGMPEKFVDKVVLAIQEEEERKEAIKENETD